MDACEQTPPGFEVNDEDDFAAYFSYSNPQSAALLLLFLPTACCCFFLCICVAAGTATSAATYTGFKKKKARKDIPGVLYVRTRYILPAVLRTWYRLRVPVKFCTAVHIPRTASMYGEADESRCSIHRLGSKERRTGGYSCSCLNSPYIFAYRVMEGCAQPVLSSCGFTAAAAYTVVL